MKKEIDIIIYGATGFTGSLCVKYLKKNYPKLKWSIGGRNKEKLTELSNKYDLNTKIFIAEGDDSNGLDKMTEKTKVILSTAGPFHRYGSKLVESCVKNSTHYVDITGETFWIKEMIKKHHEEAKRKSIRIIPSCGFDSIPSDLGVYYACREFGNSVESIHSFYKWKGEASGGTIETMFSSSDNKKRYLGPFGLVPKNSISNIQKKHTSDRINITKNSKINAWSGPFIMAIPNANIVRRSAALLAELGKGYGDNFIYKEHAYYSNKFRAYLGTIFLAIFGLTLFTPLKKIVRPFLKKPGQGPSKKVMDEGFFKGQFVLKGEDGNTNIYELFGQGDPGYKLTSLFVCESAIALLEDPSNLSGGLSYGGVLTPASGLGNILINRLQDAGISFKKILCDFF